MIPYLMPPERCVDIDSPFDFKLGGISVEQRLEEATHMTDQLTGRTIFITGSGGVLGSTYVRRMLAEGARVIASDLAGPPGRCAGGRAWGQRELPLL